MKKFVFRAMVRVARVLFLSLAGFLIMVYIFQRRLQYFPDPNNPALSTHDKALGIRAIELTTADRQQLEAWYWPGERNIDVLFLHGNAGNRADRRSLMSGFHRQGLGVLMVDYRGYGGSTGSPTEYGLYRDGQAAWDWLLENAPSHSRLLYGESIGCGVAVDLAAKVSPSALALQSTFRSAVAIGAETYPMLPVRLMMKDQYRNDLKIKQVTCPVLVIHGTEDDLIPISHGQAIFEAANPPKQWLAIPGAGHNDVPDVAGARLFQAVDAFVRTHVPQPSQEE